MEIIVLIVIAMIAMLLFSNRKNPNPLDELKKMSLSTKGKLEIQNLIQRVEAGDAYASWLIGGAYEEGKILTPTGETTFQKNKEKALWWKLQSAEKGCDLAQYNLGRMYIFGNDIPDNLVAKNYGEAKKWLGRAAENGEFNSLAALGELNLQGEKYFPNQEISHDYQKAFESFSRSVEHPTAKQYHLYDAALRIGEMYASGKGVDQDFIQAYKWMKIGGCDPDQHYEFPLKGKLTLSEIDKAENLAIEWRKGARA